MKAKRYQSIVPFIITLVILSPFLCIPKDQSLLFINGLNSPGRDIFFKNLTWFGEGFMVVCAAITLLFLRIRWFFIFVLGLLLHVFLIQFNKQILFNDIYRPSVYMSWICQDHLLHFIEGIRVRREVSFPSGHTTGAAFAASFIALVFNSNRSSITLALLAISVGFSRVYLAQHFLIDVYFGFLFGTLSSIVAFVLTQKITSRYLWMDKYLIPVKSRRLKIRLAFLRQSFVRGLRSYPKY
ncbi:phosphatase PAP2 family protein [Aquimarina sp. LLG6339-5]|uniref:phosphatase PAP2 family protein n=1 Tax=Aquimarina sp. LLG6339-5 TaxID=3160830 RepID=UPI00386AECB3